MDGYGTDEDSQASGVMARSRPGEGNNLFGGRQKIYKIPVGASGSTANLDSPGTGRAMGGKFLYENDVNMSAFQRLREKERERERQLERERENLELFGVDRTRDRANSPPLSGYNRNRETSSTTSSAPSIGRMSTAATSVASQGASSIRGGGSRSREETTPSLPLPNGSIGRSGSKTRRLYEHGLDRQLHDHQSSALTRLDQITRQRTLGGTPPPGLYASLSQANSATNLNERYRQAEQIHSSSRPASPPLSARAQGLQNFDFGIAHNGSSSPIHGYGQLPLSPPMSEGDDRSNFSQFPDRKVNGPSRQFDEKAYTERQLQLQQVRGLPSPPRRISPPPVDATDERESQRSRSESANRRKALQLDGFNLKAAVTNRPNFLESPNAAAPQKSLLTSRSVSDMSSQGESEAEGERILSEFEGPVKPTTTSTLKRPDDSEHPAYKQETPPISQQAHAKKPSTGSSKSLGIKSRKGSLPSLSSPSFDKDSPTLGPAAGLSGLVRQHLRNDSESSSYYGASSPTNSQFFPDDYKTGARSSRADMQSIYSNMNPWDGDDAASIKSSKTDNVPSLPTYNDPVPQLPVNFNRSNNHRAQDSDMPARSGNGGPAHDRGESGDTIRGNANNRPNIDQERRLIQSTLKQSSEGRNRSGSRSANSAGAPNSASASPVKPAGYGTGFGKPDMYPPTKGTRNQGMAHSPGPNYGFQQNTHPKEDYWRDEEEKIKRSVVRGPMIPTPQMRRQERRNQAQEQRHRGESTTSKEDLQSPRGYSPSTSRASARDRSGSDTSRSRSRNGGHTNDGSNGSINGYTASPRKYSNAQAPSLEVTPEATSDRSVPSSGHSSGRTIGKESANGYFDRTLGPIKTSGISSMGNSARGSPLTPFSANSTPPLDDSPPSTAAAGDIPHRNPHGFQKSGPIPRNRKKSINKSDISEPTLISSTFSSDTVSLPPGASLSNGSEAPPLPPINPRRHRRPTAMQAVSNALHGGRSEKRISPPMTAHGRQASDERSTFSGDEGDSDPSRYQLRLKKSASEGGNLNAKARQQAMMVPSPSMPTMGLNGSPPKRVGVDGGMF